jgi:hypothetical protein
MKFSLLIFLLLVLKIPSAARRVSPPILPDPTLTPGDALDVTVQDICTPGYTKKIRDVPESVNREVYAEYGITSHKPREYEIDHLKSLEIGGSNAKKNLWPQAYNTQPYNAHVKDRLENKLHKMVCDGVIDLKTAQREIATDWIAAYRKNVGTDIPPYTGGNPTPAKGRNPTPAPPGPSSGQIIGNKNSKIYNRPNCPDYDKVSAANRVTFKSEAETEAAGYRRAKNCP